MYFEDFSLNPSVIWLYILFILGKGDLEQMTDELYEWIFEI